MEAHQQTWVKINAHVDEGIACLVSALNNVVGLETIESCQGEPAINPQGVEPVGYVYFYYGDWQKICHFAFNVIKSAFVGIQGASISVEIFNGSDPMGKISVSTPLIPKLTTALTEAISRHKTPCSYGMAHIAPRN